MKSFILYFRIYRYTNLFLASLIYILVINNISFIFLLNILFDLAFLICIQFNH